MVKAFLAKVWHQGKASAAVGIGAILLIIGGLYESIAYQFYIGPTAVTAGTFHQACANPVAASIAAAGSCAQAASDVAAQQHFYILGILALLTAIATGYHSLCSSQARKVKEWFVEGCFWTAFWLIAAAVSGFRADRVFFFLASVVITFITFRVMMKLRSQAPPVPTPDPETAKPGEPQ